MKVNYDLHVRAERPTPRRTRPPLRRPYRVQFKSSDANGFRALRDWWSVGSYATLAQAQQGMADKLKQSLWSKMDRRIWDAYAKKEVEG